MNIGAAISLGIGVASFIIGIIWKVVDLSMNFGKLTQVVDNNEQRDQEEREKSESKFEEIFNRMAKNESVALELEATVQTMSQSINRIEDKLDRIIERGIK